MKETKRTASLAPSPPALRMQAEPDCRSERQQGWRCWFELWAAPVLAGKPLWQWGVECSRQSHWQCSRHLHGDDGSQQSVNCHYQHSFRRRRLYQMRRWGETQVLRPAIGIDGGLEGCAIHHQYHGHLHPRRKSTDTPLQSVTIRWKIKHSDMLLLP